MSKIFITGSSDGLGLLTAKSLIKQGHAVTLHARNSSRANDAKTACPGAQQCLIADLTSLSETKSLASELNALGPWDAIIHNAGLYRGAEGKKGPEGLPALFAVNTLAPYVLSCLVTPPAERMVFVSSQLHQGGSPTNLMEKCSYSDSKLHNIMLAFYFARKFGESGVKSNSLDPGWVATKMGGKSAPDDIGKAVETYVSLATGVDGTGRHWYQGRERGFKGVAADEGEQRRLVEELERISGVEVPRSTAIKEELMDMMDYGDIRSNFKRPNEHSHIRIGSDEA